MIEILKTSLFVLLFLTACVFAFLPVILAVALTKWDKVKLEWDNKDWLPWFMIITLPFTVGFLTWILGNERLIDWFF